MRILADTNLLLRSVEETREQHAGAMAAMARCDSLGHELVVVLQVLYEFWVVATRPVSRNGPGLAARHADRETHKLFSLFTLLRDDRTIFDRWLELVNRYDVKGKNAHDTRLVAAMHRHRLTHILTFNVADFGRYRTIVAIAPGDLSAGTSLLAGGE